MIKKISIVILTYNGLSDHFVDTFNMLKKQICDCEVEIIVIDSGSTDGTIEFIKKQKKVILYQMPNSDFGHGKTRQLGVKLASGEYIVFLTQDATPQNNFWLKYLVNKINSDNKIMAVSSRILPREDVIAIRKYNVLSEWCADNKNFVVDKYCDRCSLKLNNISTIYRKIFLLKYSFDDVVFGEDVLIAKKILKNNGKIGFASKSVVLHSHSYTILKTYKRNKIDGWFNMKYFSNCSVKNPKNIIFFIKNKWISDIIMLKKDNNISIFQKFINFVYSPIIHCFEALGQYKGYKKYENNIHNS